MCLWWNNLEEIFACVCPVVAAFSLLGLSRLVSLTQNGEVSPHSDVDAVDEDILDVDEDIPQQKDSMDSLSKTHPCFAEESLREAAGKVSLHPDIPDLSVDENLLTQQKDSMVLPSKTHSCFADESLTGAEESVSCCCCLFLPWHVGSFHRGMSGLRA